MARHRIRYHRRRNPGLASVKEVLPIAGWAIAGGVGSSTAVAYLPAQFSAGWMGVLATAGVALALSMLGGKFAGAKAEQGILIGGIVAAGGRAANLLLGKNIVAFTSLKGYGPYQFPLPSTSGSGPLLVAPTPAGAGAAGGMGRRARGAW